MFVRLCRTAEVRGNLVPDAYLAAMAVERDALLYSADRGFARFDELWWRHPFDDPVQIDTPRPKQGSDDSR